MPDGQLLEFSGVTKRFGAVTAVSGLTARVEPGQVTGFLGPNGAGKTTTLRILLGLVRATDGRATIGGRRYAELDKPLQSVGAVLEASSFHPGRTAAAHLTIYAQAAGIATSRVGEVLDLVGLTDAANRKVGGFSLGMRQRLGLAYALLGDPGVLVLDEPANGLDPEGIRWMRGFLRRLAGEGRTVLVSSHLLAEVQQTVDALLIISGGRLVFQGSIDELTDPDESATVVDAPDRGALTAALQTAGVPFEVLRSGLTVRGLDPAAVGAAAAAAGIALSSLHRRGPALEEVFLDLVNGTRVHTSAAGPLVGLSQVPGTDDPPAAAAAVGVAAAADVGEGGAEPDGAAESDRAAEPALTAAELDAESDGAPGAAARASYAVASTGVIDIVPAGTSDQRAEAEATAVAPAAEVRETDASIAAASVDAPEADEAASPEAVPEEAERSAAQEASDVSALAEAWAPEDADPDVEAIGTIDDELSAPEPADADDDRPWEHYVKTDSDLEADAFFAAFDAHGNPHPVPDSIPDADTDLGADSGHSAGPAPGPAPELDAEIEHSGDPDVSPEAAPSDDAASEGGDVREGPAAPSRVDADKAAESADEASVPASDGDADRGTVDAPESGDQEGGDR